MKNEKSARNIFRLFVCRYSVVSKTLHAIYLRLTVKKVKRINSWNKNALLTSLNSGPVVISANNISVPENSIFKDVMAEAGFVDVDPYGCIPFVDIRKVTRSGVLRFVSIFSRRSAASMGSVGSVISCGLDTTVVVELE